MLVTLMAAAVALMLAAGAAWAVKRAEAADVKREQAAIAARDSDPLDPAWARHYVHSRGGCRRCGRLPYWTMRRRWERLPSFGCCDSITPGVNTSHEWAEQWWQAHCSAAQESMGVARWAWDADGREVE